MEKLIEIIKEKNIRIIAIDGRCASGKTTLARELARLLNAELIHLDDFFLSNNQKTTERLQEVGGNIDYERFLKDVLVKLTFSQSFSYLTFDCTSQTLAKEVYINNNRTIIIEGTYSHHPKFLKYIDLKVFLTVNAQEQIERLKVRSPKLVDRFINEWIPMEEKYFETLKIQEHSDYVIDTSKI